MVHSIVIFELKNNIRNWSNQNICFHDKGTNIDIRIKDTECRLEIKGSSEKNNYKYIIDIWKY